MHGDDPVKLVLAAMVLMQPVFGVCFVMWWALRKLVFEDHRAGEPLAPRAPDVRHADAGAAAAAARPDPRRQAAPPPPGARPDPRPRQPARARQASSSGRQGDSARPRRRPASPAARNDRAPDKRRGRTHAPSRDSLRPARPAGAIETPGAPSQAAGQASRGQQPDPQPTATPQRPAVEPPELAARRPRRADDSSDGDDDGFDTRPRQGAAADVIEAKTTLLRAVLAEYAQRFRARESEGWVQNPRGPGAAEPTPSALQAQRMRARMAT